MAFPIGFPMVKIGFGFSYVLKMGCPWFFLWVYSLLSHGFSCGYSTVFIRFAYSFPMKTGGRSIPGAKEHDQHPGLDTWNLYGETAQKLRCIFLVSISDTTEVPGWDD